jgi:hypothetical protein
MSEKTAWEAAIEVEPKTESERYLTQLGHRAFLSLWCSANVHTDEGKTSATGDGKELCDLLVVFGNHILIFSDKDCKFSAHPDIKVAWGRWYKHAVDKSVRQLIGAEKFLREHSDRLFLDKQCIVPFPYKLPKKKDAVIHLIAVTKGSNQAALAHWGGGSSGSLMLDTGLENRTQHLETPFTVGWPVGRERFIHVLDEMTLDILLHEFDTLPDLINYFSEKEQFLNSARYVNVSGEEELIAHYQMTMERGKHVLPCVPPNTNAVAMLEGTWKGFNSSAQRKARDAANEQSYLWDHMIEYQSKFIRAGQAKSPFADDISVDGNEKVVRALASETRFARRLLAKVLEEALRKSVQVEEDTINQFTRIMPSPSVPGRYYVFTVMPPTTTSSYDEYREGRVNFLMTYCEGLSLKYPDIIEAVGIASEPMAAEVSSQDFLYVSFEDPLSPVHLEEIRKRCDDLNILQDSTMNQKPFQSFEYPEVFSLNDIGGSRSPANRAERRAQQSADRRRKGSRRGSR